MPDTYDPDYTRLVRLIFRYQAACEALEKVRCEPWELLDTEYFAQQAYDLERQRDLLDRRVNPRKAQQQIAAISARLTPQARRQRLARSQRLHQSRVRSAEQYLETIQQELIEAGLR